MGQRFQSFINLENLSKQFYSKKHLENKKLYKGKLPEYMELMIQKEDDDKAFGVADNMVLSFHHNWLYGRSAPLACLNILDFLDGTDKLCYDTNPFNPEYYNYYSG